MVSTKLRPPRPKSHAERTTKWRGLAAAVGASPASFDAPYADSGAGASDSTYGSPLRPSNT